MLLVRAKPGPSRIHGNGLIAAEFIEKGRKIWEFVPWFDRIFTEQDLGQMSRAARENVEWYAYKHQLGPEKEIGGSIWVLSMDDDRFTNHSDDPNTRTIHDPLQGPAYLAPSFALRNIEIGEEITWNYTDFHGLEG